MDAWWNANNGWWNNPWPNAGYQGRNNGEWYINGVEVPAHQVIRRDPNYMPFQSVSMAGLPAMHSGYTHTNLPGPPYADYSLGYDGYPSMLAWTGQRPTWASPYAGFDASGAGLVNQFDAGSYPWYYNQPYNWGAETDRPMYWMMEGPEGWY